MNDVSDESLSLSLQLIKVNELARQGRFKEAEIFLAPNGTPPENTVVLRALAVIATQQENYARALSLWKTLLQRDAKNLEAQEMIAAIETWTARPAWFRFLPAGAAAAAVLIVGIAGWWAIRPAPNHPAAPASSTPVVTTPARPATNALSTTAPKPAAPAPVATPPPASTVPAVHFELPAAKPKK